MSFKGIIVSCLLLLILSSGSIVVAQEGVSLNFMFVTSNDEAVQKSRGAVKNVSAFIDTDNDGIVDQVNFDGEEIAVDIDMDSVVGFPFEDGSKVVFYPTNLGWLPAPGTYEVVGFVHQWNDKTNRFVSILIHQDENYDTSEGITAYIIDQAGVMVGSLYYAFMEKGFLRYTDPYKEWMETGEDFAIGTSKTVSNYVLLGKDLGLMDNVLVINMSLVSTAIPPGQDIAIRSSDSTVVAESKGRLGSWGALGSPDFSSGTSRVSVKVDEDTINGNILMDQGQGITYHGNRYAVFYPSDMTALPVSPAEGTNWEILGLLHYFDDDGEISSLLAVLIGQVAGDETTSGARMRVVDNAGLAVGSPEHFFFPRRSVKVMGSNNLWDTQKYNWALGIQEDSGNKIIIVKDLGIIDKILIMGFNWY